MREREPVPDQSERLHRIREQWFMDGGVIFGMPMGAGAYWAGGWLLVGVFVAVWMIVSIASFMYRTWKEFTRV